MMCKFAPSPTVTSPWTTVPSRKQLAPAGTASGVGRGTSPPWPSQEVTRSAWAGVAVSARPPTAKAAAAEAATVLRSFIRGDSFRRDRGAGPTPAYLGPGEGHAPQRKYRVRPGLGIRVVRTFASA